jgi:hypothetical protein
MSAADHMDIPVAAAAVVVIASRRDMRIPAAVE